jgi:hypothetical protein
MAGEAAYGRLGRADPARGLLTALPRKRLTT